MSEQETLTYIPGPGAIPTQQRGQSPTIGKIIEALCQAQLEFTTVKKENRNPLYGSWYADLHSIIDATKPALTRHRLHIWHRFYTNVETRALTVVTQLAHISGEWLENEVTLPAIMSGKDGKERFDAQSVGAAQTYGRRQGIQALLNIAADEDDDANSAIGKANSREAQKEIAQRKIDELSARLSKPAIDTVAPPKELKSKKTGDDLFQVWGNSYTMNDHRILLLQHGKKAKGPDGDPVVEMTGEQIADFTHLFEQRGGKVIPS